jgi:NADPH2:quinone reductase
LKFIDLDKANNLVFSETDMPVLKPDECLIKVHAIGVNRADILQRQGHYPPPAGESQILGLEVAGELVELGAEVKNWQLCDKVFGLVPGGAYAQYAKVKASQLFSLPQSLSYQQGACIAEVFLTAYQSLFTLANVQPGQCVLLHAGASGVGSAAIQLAKAIQCQVTVTVGSQRKAERCLTLGADHAINYQQTDFVEWKKTHVPQGFDVIVDVVGGNYLTKNIDAAAIDARIVLLSMLGGRYSDGLDLAKLLYKRITLCASTLRNRSDDYKALLVRDFSAQFLPKFALGQLNPVIDTVYNWTDADSAHQKMLNNQSIGKLVLSLA